MKNIIIIIFLFISTTIFSQNNIWETVANEIKINKINEDKNAENLKTGDSIKITDYSTLNFENREVKNSKLIIEKTTYENGIINSGISLIKPEEIYEFKKNSKYKIYHPYFLNDEINLELVLNENTTEEELNLLIKNIKSLPFINSTKYLNPRESNKRKYDANFGKEKYSISMIMHSAQQKTILVYFVLNKVNRRNIKTLNKSLSKYNFIYKIFGIELLNKRKKGNFIIMET
jgi:hypothetical protein